MRRRSNRSNQLRPTFVAMLFLAILYQSSDGAYELDNSLLGQPNISCHPDTIEMRFRTKRPFTGKIYVQGHYSNPDCRVDFSQAGGADHDGRGGIRLHHGSCDMDRQRMVATGGHTGMQFSTILVISFHPLFVTKTDRAFHINCVYKEDDKSVDAGMTVGDVTPSSIQNDMPVPQCIYTIRKDELNGEVLKFARVGDLIVHRWECESDQYGMLVHSCYVEDGQGDRVQVIDERGCHKDQNVLGDPTYSEALNLAYRESYVFKFRDRVGVRFSCEIKLCMKAEDGCADITPPDCQGHTSQQHYQHSRDDPISGFNQSRMVQQNRVRRSPTPIHSQSLKTVDADLISQYVFVLDEPVEGDDDTEGTEGGGGKMPAGNAVAAQQSKLRTRTSKVALGAGGHGGPICISSTLFAAIVILVLISFGLASAVVAHALCRQFRCPPGGRSSCGRSRPLTSASSVLSSPLPGRAASSITAPSSGMMDQPPPTMICQPHSLFFHKR